MAACNGFDIADCGAVVGLPFEDNFDGAAVAFAWNAADGMSALPVLRPQNYSRANAISADGRVIVLWNDGNNRGRPGITWPVRVPVELFDPSDYAVGEASGVSSNGQFVVGSEYMDAASTWTRMAWGSWRWSAATGVQMVPMGYAFGVSDDGKTVLGTNDFFEDPPRSAMIWREGIGTMSLAACLAEQGITIPDGIDPDLAGGFGAISGDGKLMGGWTSSMTGYRRISSASSPIRSWRMASTACRLRETRVRDPSVASGSRVRHGATRCRAAPIAYGRPRPA